MPCASQQPILKLAVRHRAELLLRSRENAREGRSQGSDLDFSQQESASENKFGCTSAPLTKRLQAWVREENKVQPCLCTTMQSRGMESDYSFICLRCSLWSCTEKKKNIYSVKQTVTLSRENSYLAHDCWNRKYLLNKPLNLNSKVLKSWLGNLCENTYSKTLLQKHLDANYTFLPESFHVSLWFWKMRHDLSSHHHNWNRLTKEQIFLSSFINFGKWILN